MARMQQSKQAPNRNGSATSPELDQCCRSHTANVPLSVTLSVIFSNTELNVAQPGSCGVLPWDVLVAAADLVAVLPVALVFPVELVSPVALVLGAEQRL